VTIYVESGDVGLALDGSARFGSERSSVRFVAMYRYPIRAAHTAAYGFRACAAHAAPYGIATVQRVAHAAPYMLAAQGRVAHAAVYDLAVLVRRRLRLDARYALTANTVQVITEGPYITAGARRMEVLEASVSTEADNIYWTARIALASMNDFYSLVRGDSIVLNIQGDEWTLIVDSLSKNRGGRAQASFEITALSPASLLMDEPITKTWPATGAQAIVEELVGPVDWQIIDWMVPADRLSAVNTPSGEVAKQVVETAGGVLESMPDGSLRVRYLYPVSLPAVPGATVQQTLLEDADVVNLRDSFVRKRIFNSITLSDEATDFGYLQAERDPFQQDDILSAEQQRYVVWLDSKTSIVDTVLSDGTLQDLGERFDTFEETITFGNTNKASVQKPIYGDLQWTWYGAGLGDLQVGSDERSVVAEQSGIAMALVSYTSKARVFGVTAPYQSGGRIQFPILVYIVGAVGEGPLNAMRITVMRGAGDIAADDEVVSLAGNENVLLQRGRNYIDEQAQKREVNMEVRYRGDFMKGQLCEVVDTMDGITWRGQIRSTEHRCARARVLTSLGIERFL